MQLGLSARGVGVAALFQQVGTTLGIGFGFAPPTYHPWNCKVVPQDQLARPELHHNCLLWRLIQHGGVAALHRGKTHFTCRGQVASQQGTRSLMAGVVPRLAKRTLQVRQRVHFQLRQLS